MNAVETPQNRASTLVETAAVLVEAATTKEELVRLVARLLFERTAAEQERDALKRIMSWGSPH